MSFHAWRQAWFVLSLLAACWATDELDGADSEIEIRAKPHVLEVIEQESKQPDPNVEIRVLQRHGRAPIPPAMGMSPSSEEELMREFDEVTIEWKTSELISSILLRLPERQQELLKTNATFDGYKFFTGPNGECKFQISDKHALPDEPDVPARNQADEHMIRSCIADNSDVLGTQARRSASLLKLHPDPNPHHASEWRYFTMLIRNPLKTPVRNSMDAKMANTFQLVMNRTDGKTLVAMSFEALQISPPWVCSYTPWFKASACIAACGGGYRKEYRRMLHVPPAGYDPELLVNCRERVVRATPCNTHECDVDCQLSEWTEWPKGECSRSCGNGTQVERRYVVMGPKGNGKVCPPWHTMGVRVRTVPCNPFPCEPSCSESELAEKYRALAEASPIQLPVQDDEGEAPNASSDNQTGEAPNASSDNQTEAQNATTTPEQPENSEEDTPGSAPSTSAQSSEEDGDEESKQSLLSLGTQRGSGNSGSEFVAYETPRLETGLVKSACDEPCGGGKRVVLIPSDKKVSFGEEDRSCSYTFQEDCNLFACTPLMLQPANAWQYPLVGEWFMVDVSFVIEELSESFTFRAPPDFLLAATGSRSECFLVEHSLPNLESCTIYPGQASDRTGPIMVFNFSNPLEPQNSFTWKRDWYYFRTWVQHPKECSGGIKNGRCLGQVGERQWVLSVRDNQPEPLWELVRGSYEIFTNESYAKEIFEANGVLNRSFTEDAVEVTTTLPTTATTTKKPETTPKPVKQEKKNQSAAKSEDEEDEDDEKKHGSGSLMEAKAQPVHQASTAGAGKSLHKHQHRPTRSGHQHSHQEGHDVQAHHAHHHAGWLHRKTA